MICFQNNINDRGIWVKNKNLQQSIRVAINGIFLGFKEEKNFKTYMVIAFVFFTLNILTRSTLIEYIFYVIIVALVIATELLNTAVERIIDRFVIEKNKDAQFIKDISAGAVLIFGIAFFIIEGIILILW